MYLLLSLAAVALLLVVNEMWWRRKASHSEHHRKLVHMLVGTFVAFWPYYLNWTEIRLVSLAFLVGVALSKVLNIFASIHEVERFSLGEICFALSVGALTFITHQDWIYTASLLQMSLADGMAAIVGLHWGQNNSYKVFGSKKSLAGSLAFLIVSLAILITAKYLSGSNLALWLIPVAALIATGVENIAIYGLDDLLLPLVTAIILTRL